MRVRGFCFVLVEVVPALLTGCDDCTKQAQQIWGSVDVNLPNLLSPSDLEQSWSSGPAHVAIGWLLRVCFLLSLLVVLHVRSLFYKVVWSLVGHLCIMDLCFRSRWWYQHHRITPRWYLVMSTSHALPAEGSKWAHWRVAGVVDVHVVALWLQRWRLNLCWLVWWANIKLRHVDEGAWFLLCASRSCSSLAHWMWWLYKTSSTDLRFRWCQFT